MTRVEKQQKPPAFEQKVLSVQGEVRIGLFVCEHPNHAKRCPLESSQSDQVLRLPIQGFDVLDT